MVQAQKVVLQRRWDYIILHSERCSGSLRFLTEEKSRSPLGGLHGSLGPATSLAAL